MKPQETIAQIYKKKINMQQKVSFISTLIIGFLAHFFVLTNVLNNYDNIRCTPIGAGAGVASGRWMLSLVNDVWHRFWGVYNLTFFNGFISIFMVSISACIVISIFNVKSLLNCILIGGILVSFPSITSMLFFTFTAPYYSGAIFLSVVAVWFWKKWKYGFVVSACCIACSMGIYQAYLPLTITLFVLLLVVQCIEKKWNIIDTFLNGMKSLMCIVAGVAVYYILLKFFLWYYHTSLDAYQGIDSMGQIDLKTLPAIIKKCILNSMLLFRNDYCSISSTNVLKFGVLIIIICTAALVIINLYRRHAKVQNIICVLILGTFLIIASDSIEIMCPSSNIYCLMVYSISILFCAPIILAEICPEKSSVQCKYLTNFWDWVLTMSVIVIIINYVWQANGNYMSSYYTTEQTVAYFQTLVTRIKSVEGYSDKYPVAFIGENFEDDSFKNLWKKTPFWYGGHTPVLINRYSRDWFMTNYLGYSYTGVSEEVQKKLEKQTVEMPCYPESGSIKVIDNVVVVKRNAVSDEGK